MRLLLKGRTMSCFEWESVKIKQMIRTAVLVGSIGRVVNFSRHVYFSQEKNLTRHREHEWLTLHRKSHLRIGYCWSLTLLSLSLFLNVRTWSLFSTNISSLLIKRTSLPPTFRVCVSLKVLLLLQWWGSHPRSTRSLPILLTVFFYFLDPDNFLKIILLFLPKCLARSKQRCLLLKERKRKT